MTQPFSVEAYDIDTERLRLRPWRPNDLLDFYEYASVPGVGEMAGWPHHTSLDETQKILDQFIKGEEVFALVLKSTDKVIGSLGVHKVEQEPLAKEIGYVLNRDYWGQGIMVEAVKAVLDLLFIETDIPELLCCCSTINDQSRRVMEKAGFLYARSFDRKREVPGSEASYEYRITREDYEAMEQKKASFENDYDAGCHPRILNALVGTNDDRTTGYGLDAYSVKAQSLIRAACGREDADVHFVVGGTQANLITVAGALKPWQGVLSADTGHINVHEAGAIEATGHKVLIVPSEDGKLSAEAIDQYCKTIAEDPTAEHMVQPGMIYLSHPTELGTLYDRVSLEAIRRVADDWNLILYIDGARMASALAREETGLDLPAIAALTDVFSIGGTKCGALFGEALVITKDSLKKDFRSLMKQRGGLLAKGRLLGLQFSELFSNDLYLEIGQHENEMAQKLAARFTERGISFFAPPETNQLFVLLNAHELDHFLRRAVFERMMKTEEGHEVCRFVTSYATSVEDIEWLFGE